MLILLDKIRGVVLYWHGSEGCDVMFAGCRGSIDMDEERTEWKEEIFEMQEREVECAWSEESMWTLHVSACEYVIVCVRVCRCTIHVCV